MTDWNVENKGKLRGEFEVPGDKSISHRSVVLGAISTGDTMVSKWLFADDVLRTIKAFQQLGVEVEIGDTLRIHGRGKRWLQAPKEALDLGNSGTGIRLMSGIVAGMPFESTLTGDETLQKRPMKRVIEPLSLMGAKIEAVEGGYPPLKITGGDLTGIDYKLPVASAQVKSAILLASLYAKGKTRIVEPAYSRDHTERMLSYFGVEIFRNGLAIELECGQNLYSQTIEVPGDISAAAFFIVAGLIVPGSRITIQNVGINPTRSGVIDALKKMGAEFDIQNLRSASGEPVADIYVHAQDLKGAELSGELIPRLIDEIPVLAVAAAMAEGTTVIKNAGELRVKESDRIKSTTLELRKMGVNIEEREDGMVIEGRRQINGAVVDSHKDHRVAMSLAVAALVAKGRTRINSVEWVETSFPGFLKKLNSLVA
jgi:3-phosphoshikimate 1-carboxyvinyltransferase